RERSTETDDASTERPPSTALKDGEYTSRRETGCCIESPHFCNRHINRPVSIIARDHRQRLGKAMHDRLRATPPRTIRSFSTPRDRRSRILRPARQPHRHERRRGGCRERVLAPLPARERERRTVP